MTTSPQEAQYNVLLARTRRMLVRRGWVQLIQILACLALGFFLVLVGPCLVVCMADGAAPYGDERISEDLPMLFLVSAVIMVPFALWMTAGDGLSDDTFLVSMAPGAGIVIDYFRKLRFRWKSRGVDKNRAAEIVLHLLTLDRGVKISALLREGETLKAVVPAVVYLKSHNWIGVSENRKRIWLWTQSRQLLSGIEELLRE